MSQFIGMLFISSLKIDLNYKLNVALMILKIAVPGPFLTPLDYCFQLSNPAPVVGGRVWVKLRGRKLIGIVLATNAESDLLPEKIMQIDSVVDEQALFSKRDLELLQWAAHYYHEPIGNVFQTALPKRLRQGETLELPGVGGWMLSELGKTAQNNIKSNAIQQLSLMKQLLTTGSSVQTARLLNENLTTWRSAMKRFEQLGWVEKVTLPCLHAGQENHANLQIKHSLNDEQQQAVDEVVSQKQLNSFKAFLLEGVTGSGKTEAYLGMIEAVLKEGKQALVLVPEIGLTPQTVARFEAFLKQPVALMHSALSDKERHCAWFMIKTGQIKVLLGTRSAIFTPFKNLGICILDEEHDLSFKQQDSFRYSARDCLIRRAHLENVPVVLGSATPSLETLHNALIGRYGYLKLNMRAGGADMPDVHLLDVRGDDSLADNAGISSLLKEKISEHVQQGNQVLLFLNRRGYAPVLMCQDCGWQANCQSCDANMTYHHQYKQLKCHHCGYQQNSPIHCPSCTGTKLSHQGQGTEKLAQVVQEWFPDEVVLRVDRDTTRNKGQMAEISAKAAAGEARILIGTQMLAKGHHFPKVTLVAILEIDQGLFSCDFRAAERMAQLTVQVSGRAGRAKQKGEVFIQTLNPEHPLLKTLVNSGYSKFASEALHERRAAELPPYSYQILLRAESTDPQLGWSFLQDVQNALMSNLRQGLEVFGPVAAPMLKKESRFRYQLLMQASNRGALHNWLGKVESQIYAYPDISKIRWSIDVDPQDMN